MGMKSTGTVGSVAEAFPRREPTTVMVSVGFASSRFSVAVTWANAAEGTDRASSTALRRTFTRASRGIFVGITRIVARARRARFSLNDYNVEPRRPQETTREDHGGKAKLVIRDTGSIKV